MFDSKTANFSVIWSRYEKKRFDNKTSFVGVESGLINRRSTYHKSLITIQNGA